MSRVPNTVAPRGDDFSGIPERAKHLLHELWAIPGAFPAGDTLLIFEIQRRKRTALAQLPKRRRRGISEWTKDSRGPAFAIPVVIDATERPVRDGDQACLLVPCVVHVAIAVRGVLPIIDAVAVNASLEDEVRVAADGLQGVVLDAAKPVEDRAGGDRGCEVIGHQQAASLFAGERDRRHGSSVRE